MPKLKIKKDDNVVVLSGRDKGRQGKVLRVFPQEQRAIVQGIHIARRHSAPRMGDPGGIVEKELTIHVSNLAHIDPKTNKVVATVKVGDRPADGTRGPDGLEWIPNQGDGTISRIDPKTDRVVSTVHVGGHPFVARTAFGDVWVDYFKGVHELRLHGPT